MLLSMTGYGDARGTWDALSLHIEIRAVNNRYLKVNSRLPEVYSTFEPRVEKVVRETISRGSVTVNVSRAETGEAGDYFIDGAVLESYLNQWDNLREQLTSLPTANAGDLLQLPGVVAEREELQQAAESEWPHLEELLRAALATFQEFRVDEGRSMTADLRDSLASIDNRLQQVAERAPEVVRLYRQKMVDRVSEWLAQNSVQLQPADVIREVSLFADRSDINEEIIRLRSHLKQFEAFLESAQSEGKRLDFLSQEMNREVNTIGSKSNDVEIAHCVVEMKAAVERIREILANVE